MMASSQVCANCSNSFTEQFCNRCGQKKVHRITMSHIWHDILHAFTHADKGIFHLMGKMFVRPGIVAREYITEGKRKRYFSPFQYILIIGTIAAFVAASSHFIEGTTEALATNGQYSTKQLAFMQKINEFQSRYFNFMILLQLPFYAIATYIVYKKKRFNFAEHLTLHTFISAQATIISMLIMLSIFLVGKPGVYMITVMTFLTAGFQIFAVAQFFDRLSFRSIIKALLANIFGFFLFVIFAMIVASIYLIRTGALTK